jgi:hypothetical protein
MQDLINILAKLETITTLLRQLLRQNAPHAPNYRHPLSTYWTFDWHSIGAEIIRRDKKGATQVLWGGYLWMRRNDNGRKYGDAIWFSRADGRNDNGDLNYIRLITFKDAAEPEPVRVKQPKPAKHGRQPIGILPSENSAKTRTNGSVPTQTAATVSPESAAWQAQLAAITTLAELDAAIYAADPDWWQALENVTKARLRIAAPAGTALPRVAEALLALKQQYPIALAAEGATRTSAMEQAIAVARRTLTTAQKVAPMKVAPMKVGSHA